MKKRIRAKIKRVFKPSRRCKHLETVGRYVAQKPGYVVTCADCYKVLSR